MKNITIDNVYAKASEGTEDVAGGFYPFIWVQKGLDIENLYISNVEREEDTYPTSMIKVDEGATVVNMSLKNIKQVSRLGKEIKQLDNQGVIKGLHAENLINI